MAITAALVKELRERTGAGMMECKKALQATDGDIDKAIEEMRKAGQAKADKKASRVAAEGALLIATTDDKKYAVIVEINSETDFVARDENFLAFAKKAAKTALNAEISDVAQLANLQIADGDASVEEARQTLVAKIGENIQIRRIGAIRSNGVIGSYSHGGMIGVLVALEGGDESLAKDIAMHIAASNPIVVNADDVPQDYIEKEKEIFRAQAEKSGKPAEIIEKMIVGRLKKTLAEVSLTGQAFVKDPNITVADLLKQHNAKVTEFIRYQVGEGIEKKEDDFVSEVMAQVSDATAS